MLIRLLSSLAFCLAVMEAPKVRRNRQLRLSVDERREELLDSVATAGYRGNRSAAICALIDLHAGEALELIREARIAAPVEVEPWKSRHLSIELVRQVAGMVREGSDHTAAFKQLGIPAKTRRSWEKQGRADMDAGKPSLHATLVYAIGKAEAERDLELVQSVDSAKWLLERLSPDVYGPPVRKTESEHKVSLNAMIDWDRLDVRETQTLVMLLRKASPAADEPAISAKSKPVAELLPADVIDADVIAEDDGPEPAPAVDAEIVTLPAEVDVPSENEPGYTVEPQEISHSPLAPEAPPPEAPELEKPGD